MVSLLASKVVHTNGYYTAKLSGSKLTIQKQEIDCNISSEKEIELAVFIFNGIVTFDSSSPSNLKLK